MGQEPVGSRVTIPTSGARCCLGPLFGVNQPSTISPPARCPCRGGDREGSLQPGLGANYLLKPLVNKYLSEEAELISRLRGGRGSPNSPGSPPCPPCSPHPAHRSDTVFTGKGRSRLVPRGTELLSRRPPASPRPRGFRARSR